MLTAKICLVLIFSIPLVYGHPLQDSPTTKSPNGLNTSHDSPVKVFLNNPSDKGDELIELHIKPLGPEALKTETLTANQLESIPEATPGENDPYVELMKSNDTRDMDKTDAIKIDAMTKEPIEPSPTEEESVESIDPILSNTLLYGFAITGMVLVVVIGVSSLVTCCLCCIVFRITGTLDVILFLMELD